MTRNALQPDFETVRREIGPYFIAKRTVDLAAGTFLLLLLAPVLLATAVLVRLSLSMGSPILFRQIRPGRDERPFTLYKFSYDA